MGIGSLCSGRVVGGGFLLWGTAVLLRDDGDWIAIEYSVKSVGYLGRWKLSMYAFRGVEGGK